MITSVALKTEAGGHAEAGRLKDAAGAAQRGVGVPILSDGDGSSALRAPVFDRQNWRHRASLNRSDPA
jgi:hypothetical protein